MGYRTRRTAIAMVILGLAAWASGASAGAPRLLALGGDGAYLEDTRSPLRWYGSLVDHAGLATFETGYFDEHGYMDRASLALQYFRRSHGVAAEHQGSHLGLG